MSTLSTASSPSDTPDSAHSPRWQTLVAPYRGGDTKRSLWQLVSTLAGFGGLVATMLWTSTFSLPLTLLLALPAGGFAVRIFIIQHDCGHGSFFRSQRANDLVGTFCGVLMLTPYYEWRRSHAIHHAGAGNLARRGIGDIYTMTVNEYLALGFWRRLQYRLFRNPFVLFLLGPLFVFLLIHRIPGMLTHDKGSLKERLNVHFTTLAGSALIATGLLLVGPSTFFLVFGLPAFLGSAAGIWLFYVQHQYENAYWRPTEAWSYEDAGLLGSSYYRLPRVLQYFSGNIGFHHVHHMAPKVPNYRLQRCHEENAYFQQAVTLSLWESLKTIGLKLYDEESNRMVGFGALRGREPRAGGEPRLAS